ncbi:myb-related transcription factor, partner of profilin-like isoform X2 [Serinus canaria]|uniref:myb-related transcription factor, partner of profilin-like isoform X2 n=1 Tax=Serinus canaria TaxID=9135 RepID=UPI0021CC7BF6|nr:myb-related transcription factor, partner of profilin-like isoform X2 [Serinus canaria]
MAAAGGGGARRGLLKRKPNFTLQELEVLMSEVLRYEPLLFGAAAGTVNAYEKQKIWWRITHKVNAAGRHQRDIGEVKNRWRGLRRRAGDKISRHRLERQGPAGRAAARNGNTGSTGNNGSNGNGAAEPGPGPAPAPVWGPRGAAGTDPPMGSAEGSAQHGVKEEPLEVKTEPFHRPAADGVPGRRSDCRRPRTGISPPNEGWSRSPPRSAPTELSLGDLRGQQEPLGSDFPSLLLEQEAEQLSHCGAGEAGPPGGLDGTPECPQLGLVQSNERLVQEMRAFRREYAESRRETTAMLRGIAQALGGLNRSLAEIRDIYLRERGVPKS